MQTVVNHIAGDRMQMKQNNRTTDFPSQIVEVRRGLYALRYVSALSGKISPRITAETDSEAEIELIGLPGARYATLSEPGDLLVVRAFGPAQLRLKVTPASDGGSIVADVRLEDLKSIGLVNSDQPSPNELSIYEAQSPEIEILGHLSRVGDILTEAREWVAGPPRPSNIEGIRIAWLNQPPNVKLSVEGISGGRAQGKIAPTCPDGLIGSRGRAIPLVGLNLSLSGTAATRYNLIVESLFRGCQINETRGRSVELSGPTGSEALIGLKIDIQVLETNPRSGIIQGSDRAQIEQAAEPMRGQARVRVFKRSS